MDRPGGLEPALHQVERVHAKERPNVLPVRANPVAHRGGRVLFASGQRDVRMEEVDIELEESRGEQGVIHALTKLMQPRVTTADSHPHDPWRGVWRE